LAVYITLPPELLDRLRLDEAVSEEAQRPRSMLPSRVAEHVLEGRSREYAEAVRAHLAAGIEISVQESVWAAKPGHVGRYRILTVLPMQERVLLRALVNDLGADVPVPDRSGEAFDAFQMRPVEEEHPYVAVADVASFYFFVDHQLLESRIVEASARADSAEAIRTVLTALSQRQYGLPQNFVPSDTLSDLYISWVERRMLRRGIATHRHNDDFRLGTETWGEALQALELLGHELASIGLDLNADKSWILGQEKYQSNLGLADELFREAFPEDYPAVDPYTGEPVAPDPETEMPSDEETEQAGRAMFEVAAERRLADERQSGFELRATRELLNTGLLLLRTTRSPGALDRGPNVVAVDPSLAQSYAMYLSALAAEDEGEQTSTWILDVLERFQGYAPPWVHAWLVNPLLVPGAGLSAAASDWLRKFLSGSAPAVLRARAALALGVHAQIDVGELAVLFDVLPPAARPDIVAALAFAASEKDDRRVRAVVESEHLYRWVFEHATAHRDDASWA
jgi:Reverse transcriptase (RNA-dependent DNA polymerase)